jgi:hypothetical protein
MPFIMSFEFKSASNYYPVLSYRSTLPVIETGISPENHQHVAPI